MDQDKAIPYMVVIEKPNMHTTVLEALIKAGVSGLGAVMTYFTIRAMKKSDEKKDELKKKLAESEPTPSKK